MNRFSNKWAWLALVLVVSAGIFWWRQAGDRGSVSPSSGERTFTSPQHSKRAIDHRTHPALRTPPKIASSKAFTRLQTVWDEDITMGNWSYEEEIEFLVACLDQNDFDRWVEEGAPSDKDIARYLIHHGVVSVDSLEKAKIQEEWVPAFYLEWAQLEPKEALQYWVEIHRPKFPDSTNDDPFEDHLVDEIRYELIKGIATHGWDKLQHHKSSLTFGMSHSDEVDSIILVLIAIQYLPLAEAQRAFEETTPAWNDYGLEFRGITLGSQLAARYYLESGDAGLEQFLEPGMGVFKEDILTSLFGLSASRAVEWSLKNPEIRSKCYIGLLPETHDRYFQLIPEMERLEVLVGLLREGDRSLEEVLTLADHYHKEGVFPENSLQGLNRALEEAEQEHKLQMEKAEKSFSDDPFSN